MNAALVTTMLRAPSDVVRRCRDASDLRAIAIVSLVLIALGTGLFGAVLGASRGGIQIAFAAVKLPIAVLATLAVCVPAFHVLAAVSGRAWSLRSTVALMLAAAARAALILLALSPALWLAMDLGMHYHEVVFASAIAFGASGLAALGVLARAVSSGDARREVDLTGLGTAVGFALVYLTVLGQTSWILRPYVVRPRLPTSEIPFVRARESSFADAVFTTSQSAFGMYRREAPYVSRSR